MVVPVDLKRWNQTAEDLRELALTAKHPRTRERFLALHEIACGSNATEVAAYSGRSDESVLRWLHTYNERGPDAVCYCRTGGHPLFVQRSQARSSAKSTRRCAPQQRLRK